MTRQDMEAMITSAMPAVDAIVTDRLLRTGKAK